MKLAGAAFLFLAAWVLACTTSAIPPRIQTQPSPTPTPVPVVTPTPSPISPRTQAQPSPTPTPVPALTPTARPSPPPTLAPPRPTATAVPVPTAAGSPSASQEPAGDQPGVPSSRLAPGEKRLALIQNGDWIFIKNGVRVNVGNGISVELFLAPYPPTRLTELLDLYVTRGGEPVTNADADITYDMKGMAHGPFVSVANNQRNGHYLLTLDFIMFAAWEHKLVLYMPEDRYEVGVGIVVSPSPLP